MARFNKLQPLSQPAWMVEHHDPVTLQNMRVRGTAGASSARARPADAPTVLVSVPTSAAMSIIGTLDLASKTGVALKNTGPVSSGGVSLPAATDTATSRNQRFAPSAPLTFGTKVPISTALLAGLVDFNVITSAQESVIKAWADYYVALGNVSVANLDLVFADKLALDAQREAQWWSLYTSNPKSFPSVKIAEPNVFMPPPAVYLQCVQTFKQAMVGVDKACEILYAATRAAGYAGDDKSALKMPLSIGVTFGKFANKSDWGTAVPWDDLKGLFNDLVEYKALIKTWDASYDFAIGKDVSPMYAATIIRNVVDRLKAALQPIAGEAYGAKQIADSYATQATDAKNAVTLALMTVGQARQALSSTAAKGMPAGWTLDQYLAMPEAQRLSDATYMLTCDVLGESRAAVIVAKIAADKQTEYAARAAKIGTAMLATAKSGAGGAGVDGIGIGNGLLVQAQATSKQLDETLWAYDSATSDLQCEELDGKIALLNNQLATLQGQIAGEAIGLDHLAQKIIVLAGVSTTYNDDAMARLAHVMDRAEKDKIALEPDTLAKVAEITAQATQTAAMNEQAKQDASDALYLAKKMLDAAGDLPHADKGLGEYVKDSMDAKKDELPKSNFEKEAPKEESSAVPWILAGGAVLAAFARGA